MARDRFIGLSSLGFWAKALGAVGLRTRPARLLGSGSECQEVLLSEKASQANLKPK